MAREPAGNGLTIRALGISPDIADVSGVQSAVAASGEKRRWAV